VTVLPLTDDPAILALAENLRQGELWMTGRQLRTHLQGQTAQRNQHLQSLLENGLIVAMADAYRLTLRGALSCQYSQVYENYLARVLKALRAHEAGAPGFDAVTLKELAKHDPYLDKPGKDDAKWLMQLLVVCGIVRDNLVRPEGAWSLNNPPLEQILHDALNVGDLVRLLAPPLARPLDPLIVSTRTEGQYLERKSLWEGLPGNKRPRDRRQVRDEIAEQVAAFANADGGTLILGVEDDGTVSGHRYPAKAVDEFLDAPAARLKPPLERGERSSHDGHELLLFRVAPAAEAVMVVGNGFPRRVDDTVIKEEQSRINAWKTAGLIESWEARPSSLALADLDAELLRKAAEQAGFGGQIEEFLVRLRLADQTPSGLKLRMAACLLFVREAHRIEHPNAGVRIFRVVGKERTHGANANVEERERVEGNLPHVIERTKGLIEDLLRKPARLVGLHFQTTSEVPTSAWQEALVNAVAHRDYTDQGRGVEIWLFDDRMEILNPGGLVAGVSLDALRSRTRVHVSRNPRLTRVLALLGMMREQGEGIPRIFDEMAGSYLPDPSLEVGEHRFGVTLRNTPELSDQDARWLESQGQHGLSGEQARALVLARTRGTVDNQGLREAAGLDTLAASKVLVQLRDQGRLRQVGAGSASRYEIANAFDKGSKTPDQHDHSRPYDTSSTPYDTSSTPYDTSSTPYDTSSTPYDTSSGPSSGPYDTRLLPPDLKRQLEALGERADPHEVRGVLAALCELAPQTPAALSRLIKRDEKLIVRHYISPMLKEGVLERVFPDRPSHPKQAYRTVVKASS